MQPRRANYLGGPAIRAKRIVLSLLLSSSVCFARQPSRETSLKLAAEVEAAEP